MASDPTWQSRATVRYALHDCKDGWALIRIEEDQNGLDHYGRSALWHDEAIFFSRDAAQRVLDLLRRTS